MFGNKNITHNRYNIHYRLYYTCTLRENSFYNPTSSSPSFSSDSCCVLPTLFWSPSSIINLSATLSSQQNPIRDPAVRQEKSAGQADATEELVEPASMHWMCALERASRAGGDLPQGDGSPAINSITEQRKTRKTSLV